MKNGITQGFVIVSIGLLGALFVSADKNDKTINYFSPAEQTHMLTSPSSITLPNFHFSTSSQNNTVIINYLSTNIMIISQILNDFNNQRILPPQIMAWIYPYPPACGAVNEYSDGRKIDVLKPEFFTINGGSLLLLDKSRVGCNGYSPAFITTLKQHSKSQYVTVSSASAVDMGLFLNQALTNNTDIKTLVNFVIDNEMTGIELNFEDFGGWTTENYIDFKTFVTQLGTVLRTQNKKLMIVGPPVSNEIEEAWFLWRYEDFKYLPIDHMVVMGYDYQYDHGASEPIAPLHWLQDVIKWVSARYPQNKLTIALPSYGYEAKVGTHRFSILTHEQIKSKPGYHTATRDPSSAEMTWQYGNTIYFYQDNISLENKRALVTSLGINSISIWHLGGNLWFK